MNLLTKVLMTSLTLTTPRLHAEIQTQKINEVYLIAPKNQEKPWDKAIVCEKAPFNSVCMSEIEYRRMRVEGKILEIEKQTPCPACAQDYTSKDLLVVGGVSFSVGLLVALILRK